MRGFRFLFLLLWKINIACNTMRAKYHEFVGGLHPHHGVSRVYHPQLVAVYHQSEGLYIIKPQIYTLRVMIYAYGDDIHACA